MGKSYKVEHENGKESTIRQSVTGTWVAEKGGWLGPDNMGGGNTAADAERAAERSRGSSIKK